MTSTGDVDQRLKEYFPDLLNPAATSSAEGAKAVDSEEDLSVIQAEITEVVRKLLGGKRRGWMRSAGTVVTRLCNITVRDTASR